MFNPTELSEIKQLLETKKNIVILTHHNPDGDAIGSSLGLYHFLKSINVESTVIVPNEFPKFLKWMPNFKSIVIAEHKVKFAHKLILSADVIFCLDFNTSSRIDALQSVLQNATGTKILIDHHQQPDAFHYVYSDTSQPATCQMVYKFIRELNFSQEITNEIATCLYAGILTDTGSFRFRNTTSETHHIIADLIEKGAEPDVISSHILDANSPQRLLLLATMLNQMDVISEQKTVILYLSKEQLLENGYQKGDTEGFVNYGLSMLGIVFSVLILDDLHNDYRRMSFRSKGEFDVNSFARNYFNGGGHFNAAGGKSELSIPETIQQLKKYIQNEKILTS